MAQRKPTHASTIELLADSCWLPLYRFSFRMTGNKAFAEDAVQETFLRALDNVVALEIHDNPMAWLFRVAGNFIRDEWAKAAVRARYAATWRFAQPTIAHNPQQTLVTQELHEALQHALDRLDANQREALLLQRYGGLTHEEIAQAMQQPETTVNNWLSRGRVALAEMLDDWKDDYGT